MDFGDVGAFARAGARWLPVAQRVFEPATGMGPPSARPLWAADVYADSHFSVPRGFFFGPNGPAECCHGPRRFDARPWEDQCHDPRPEWGDSLSSACENCPFRAGVHWMIHSTGSGGAPGPWQHSCGPSGRENGCEPIRRTVPHRPRWKPTKSVARLHSQKVRQQARPLDREETLGVKLHTLHGRSPRLGPHAA